MLSPTKTKIVHKLEELLSVKIISVTDVDALLFTANAFI